VILKPRPAEYETPFVQPTEPYRRHLQTLE